MPLPVCTSQESSELRHQRCWCNSCKEVQPFQHFKPLLSQKRENCLRPATDETLCWLALQPPMWESALLFCYNQVPSSGPVCTFSLKHLTNFTYNPICNLCFPLSMHKQTTLLKKTLLINLFFNRCRVPKTRTSRTWNKGLECFRSCLWLRFNVILINHPFSSGKSVYLCLAFVDILCLL